MHRITASPIKTGPTDQLGLAGVYHTVPKPMKEKQVQVIPWIDYSLSGVKTGIEYAKLRAGTNQGSGRTSGVV